MPEPFIRLEVRGEAAEGQLARDFDRAQRRIQDRIVRQMRGLDRALPIVYKAHAPVDTGALSGSIRSTIFFRGRFVRVSVSANAVRRGFDYLPVTRYGHNVPVIRPRRRRAMTVHSAGREARPVIRRRVRAYQPRRDWVADATLFARPLIARAERKLSRDIDTVLLASARGI